MSDGPREEEEEENRQFLPPQSAESLVLRAAYQYPRMKAMSFSGRTDSPSASVNHIHHPFCSPTKCNCSTGSFLEQHVRVRGSDSSESEKLRPPPIDETFTPKLLKAETCGDGMITSLSARDLARTVREAAATEGPRTVESAPERAKESRVMVLYTGGTIGMKITADGVYSPEANYLPRTLRNTPNVNDTDYVQAYYGHCKLLPYCLPPVKNAERRIVYWVLEYEPLLDSSDMTFDDWIRIAKDIYKAYDDYDGFIVLHGTDTLSYTASALSFMLENLGKPVVVTGSQIPVCEVRSDGRRNLIDSLIIAGNYDIPEVTVLFNDKLFRGNRTSKVDNSALNAFSSPNMAPLAEFEIKIKVDHDAIYRSPKPKKMTLRTNFNRNVGIIRIFPSMSINSVKGALQEPIQGVVLQTFGSGNMPTRRTDIINELKEAIDRGVIVINLTQCQRGRVDKSYITGKVLYDIGVISGSDMTPEAALTKLSFVLGREDWNLDRKRNAMQQNLRGELTNDMQGKMRDLTDLNVVSRLAQFLRLNTSDEVQMLRESLYPPLLCSAANLGDVDLLRQLKESGANLTIADYDNRTALHVAASSGHLEAVKYLLQHGVSVHMKDRWEETPLLSAINGRHVEIISTLREAGATISLSPVSVAVALCMLAASNDLKGIQAWCAAGADVTTVDYDGRTALHVAASKGDLDMVKYLVEEGANPKQKDSFGQTPLDEARNKNRDTVTLYLASL